MVFIEKVVNVLMVGGSGHWSEKSHYPSLLSLQNKGIQYQVVAICDPINPYTAPSQRYDSGRLHLQTILIKDQPLWIDPSAMNEPELEDCLCQLHHATPIDIVIVACNPTRHFFYTFWSIQHNISVLCDKPPVLVPGASSEPESAQKIAYQFSKLTTLVRKKQAERPQLTFYMPLKRRLARPFLAIADGLAEMYAQTGQGITNMAITLNNGLHRYPQEFAKGGAHGYLEGIGALCHSSYHYLDLAAWYLENARGNIAWIGLSVPYILRVADYLQSEGYKQLHYLLEGRDQLFAPAGELSPQTLAAELDFILHGVLYDKDGHKIGLATYTNRHTTFTPRLTKYDPDILDPANTEFGGRMKQLFIDVHQGMEQNYALAMNGSSSKHVDLARRQHPHLGKSYERIEYRKDYYDEGHEPIDLFYSFIKRSLGLAIPRSHEEHLQLWKKERVTHAFFAICYEKIAEQYVHPEVTQETMIVLDE